MRLTIIAVLLVMLATGYNPPETASVNDYRALAEAKGL
jgi:hypothetical protein